MKACNVIHRRPVNIILHISPQEDIHRGCITLSCINCFTSGGHKFSKNLGATSKL
jgi:hypothetical protein